MGPVVGDSTDSSRGNIADVTASPRSGRLRRYYSISAPAYRGNLFKTNGWSAIFPADRFASWLTRSARSSHASAFARRRALLAVLVVLVANSRHNAAKDRYSASLLMG